MPRIGRFRRRWKERPRGGEGKGKGDGWPCDTRHRYAGAFARRRLARRERAVARLFQLAVLVGLGAYLYIGQDLVLGLLCLSFVPFAVWRGTVFRLRALWREFQERMSVLTRIMEENLAGIRVVHGSCRSLYSGRGISIPSKSDGRRLSWMDAQILPHFKLHAVDLHEKSRHRGTVVARVGFRIPKVRDLSLHLGNTVQRDLELSIVRDHG